MHKKFLTFIAAFLMLLSFSPANAQSTGVSSENSIDLNISGFSQRETLELLLAGQGRIAQENPQVVKALGFDPERPVADEKRLSQLISS